jgi:hypothetical protein
MAMTNPPGWMQNVGATHTAAQFRQYIAALQAGTYSTAGTRRARGGVHPSFGTEFAVTQAGSPNMTVLVGAGMASIPGTESTNQGNYIVHNDASLTLSISAAHGSLARIDLVVINIRDTVYSGADNDSQCQVVTGTPASSPVAPAAPNNSIILAQVAVGAGVTSIVTANITDLRPFMAGCGGVIGALTDALRPTSTEVSEGQLVYTRDNNRLYLWDDVAYSRLVDDYIDWTSYSPAWTSSGSAPSIGNGTLSGRYARLGNLIIGEVGLNYGSTTNGGTGVWFFSLPVTASATGFIRGGGTWFANDITVQDYSGVVKMETSTTVRMVSGTGSVGASSPFTPGNGDTYRLQFLYEPSA